MYQTSDIWKQKRYLDDTEHILKIYINNVEIDSDYILDFKIDYDLFSDDILCLGSTPAKTCEIQLYKNVVPEIINEIRVEYGILIDELTETYEIIPIGTFYLDEPQIKDDDTIILKIINSMTKFEFKYDGSLITLPATLKQVLQDICFKAGVELGSITFLNQDKQINVYDNTVTARTYLSYIAESAGCFACIGRDNKLYLRKFYQDETSLDIEMFGDFAWGSELTISRVTYQDGIRNFTHGDETKNTLWINPDNTYIIDDDQILNIYNNLVNFNTIGFEGTTIIDPAIDIGDRLIIDGKNVLFQGSMQYLGRFKASIKNKIQSKEKEDTVVVIGENAKIRKLQTQIDQNKGTITSLVSEQSSQSSQLVQQQLDLNGVKTTVSEHTNTINEEKEKTNLLEQRVDGLTNTMKETGGLNLFLNSVGYWGNENWQGNIITTTSTDIKDNTKSGNAIAIQNYENSQYLSVKNGTYTCSFMYKKIIELAATSVQINDIVIDLSSEEWKQEILTLNVTNRQITVKLIGDTVNGAYISDLMLNSGSSIQVWGLNQNETYTDTVRIGKGITISATSTNTEFNAESDGIRIKNKNTNETVTDFTDKGLTTKDMKSDTATISRLLIQNINGQVCFNNIGGV